MKLWKAEKDERVGLSRDVERRSRNIEIRKDGELEGWRVGEVEEWRG